MSIEEMSKPEFAKAFIDSVEEFYEEWKEENPGSTLPDFEDAITRAKKEGLVAQAL